MTAIIKSLRASGTYITAEVRLGIKENGGECITTVKLSRKTAEVQDALATLDNLVLREAQSVVNHAAMKTAIDTAANEKAKVLVDAANSRSRTAVTRALSVARERLKKTIDFQSRPGVEGANVVPTHYLDRHLAQLDQEINDNESRSA